MTMTYSMPTAFFNRSYLMGRAMIVELRTKSHPNAHKEQDKDALKNFDRVLKSLESKASELLTSDLCSADANDANDVKEISSDANVVIMPKR
ncbi:hypothetical protein [Vibrio anguillarum]|uniref:hypothetical protein n=1 Tax=Vibrio anguillarum TaxID=55601 RepID=UPI0018C1F63B|nr:hypothetical protein [Vibrio anguillarum]